MHEDPLHAVRLHNGAEIADKQSRARWPTAAMVLDDGDSAHSLDARASTGASAEVSKRPPELPTKEHVLLSAESSAAHPATATVIASAGNAPSMAPSPAVGNVERTASVASHDPESTTAAFPPAWQGRLSEDGLSSSDDEHCFPRQRDLDAFHLRRAQRRRKVRQCLWESL